MFKKNKDFVPIENGILHEFTQSEIHYWNAFKNKHSVRCGCKQFIYYIDESRYTPFVEIECSCCHERSCLSWR